MNFITFILLFFTSLILLIYLFTSRHFKYWKKRGIPYLEPTAFFGNLYDVFMFKKGAGILYRDIHLETQSPYTGIFVMDKPALVIKDCNLVKSILMEGFNHFVDRNAVANNKTDTLGSHLLFFMKSPEWGIYRKKMTPVFASGKIKSMFGFFENVGRDLVGYLNRKVEETDVLDFKDVATRYSTELITSIAFGKNGNCFEDGDSEFLIAAKRLLDFNDFSRALSVTCYNLAPFLVDIFRLKLIDPQSSTLLRATFWENLKQREASKYLRDDLIDSLIEMRKDEKFDQTDDFDGDKVLAQAVTFFLGGFETTSTTIAFALYELAKHPAIQNKLREELKEVLVYQGSLSYEAIHDDSLKYLEMVFKETLRKYPTVPFMDRRCNKDYQIPGTNHVIEEGVGVYISILGLHMDPNNFPNPEEFTPERFSEENLSSIKPFTYLPFGRGPRNCIGSRFGMLTSKLAIANVILNFEVGTCKDTPKKMEFHPKAALLVPLTGKIWLKFKKSTS